MVARVTRLVAEKFVLSTFPRALTTLSSMCSRAIRALESSPGLIMMMDSPDLNSFAERWVKSVKEECLSKLILFGEKSLRHALREYVVYYHHERNHQGKENLLLFPASDQLPQSERKVRSRERLGGLLRFYHREAA